MPSTANIKHRIIIQLDNSDISDSKTFSTCLESLLSSTKGRANISIIPKGISAATRQALSEMLESKKIDRLYEENTSPLEAAKSSSEALITLANPLFIYKGDWLEAIEKTFSAFPLCGVVSPIPNPSLDFSIVSITLLSSWSSGFFHYGKNCTDSEIDLFCLGVNDLNRFSYAERKHQHIVKHGPSTACIGAYPGPITINKSLIGDLTDADISGICRQIDKKGHWVLSTPTFYAYPLTQPVSAKTQALVDHCSKHNNSIPSTPCNSGPPLPVKKSLFAKLPAVLRNKAATLLRSSCLWRPHAALKPGKWLAIKRQFPVYARSTINRVEDMIFSKKGVSLYYKTSLLKFSPGTAINFGLLNSDHIEEHDYLDQIISHVDSSTTFFDVGAHFGIYTLAAATSAKKVFSFEPTPETFAHLSKNIRLNNFPVEVQAHQLALSDKIGEVSFQTESTRMTNSIVHDNSLADNDKKIVTIKTQLLDTYFDENLKSVIKIDTEGEELRVLQGAQKFLASDAKIFVELHPWLWKNKDSTWKALKAMAEQHNRIITLSEKTILDCPHDCRIELLRRA